MSSNGETEDRQKKNVLILTAHPDDECMFFAPTILYLTRNPSRYEVFILCMTNGNFYKKGDIRQHEFNESCAILGIKSSNTFIEDNSDLRDDPLVNWENEIVAGVVSKYLAKYNIDQIFTFDAGGVSGHANHRALYRGVGYILKSGKLRRDVTAYALETTSIFRKYISVLDILFSSFHKGPWFVGGCSDIITAQRAMYAHWSQFEWFRALYVAFSRYMTVNTYNKID